MRRILQATLAPMAWPQPGTAEHVDPLRCRRARRPSKVQEAAVRDSKVQEAAVRDSYLLTATCKRGRVRAAAAAGWGWVGVGVQHWHPHLPFAATYQTSARPPASVGSE